MRRFCKCDCNGQRRRGRGIARKKSEGYRRPDGLRAPVLDLRKESWRRPPPPLNSIYPIEFLVSFVFFLPQRRPSAAAQIIQRLIKSYYRSSLNWWVLFYLKFERQGKRKNKGMCIFRQISCLAVLIPYAHNW